MVLPKIFKTHMKSGMQNSCMDLSPVTLRTDLKVRLLCVFIGERFLL